MKKTGIFILDVDMLSGIILAQDVQEMYFPSMFRVLRKKTMGRCMDC